MTITRSISTVFIVITLISVALAGFIIAPAVVDGVSVENNDHNVYALNASTGTKLWNFTTGSGVPSSPAVANGVIYVGSYDKNVYALNATTGAKIWNFTTGGHVDSSPAVANGVVYVGSGTVDVVYWGCGTPDIPGFGAIFAVIGLAIVAYVAGKKR
jgi:PGF-CTERM protein